jgi:hypothetical protein
VITVLATREGLVGQRTSSGYIIDTVVRFVALPSRRALFRDVRVTNPLTSKAVLAQVLDVGPHNDSDDSYVFGEARPLAEAGISFGTYSAKNRAGIDLGEAVWHYLGMVDNSLVEWEFI